MGFLLWQLNLQAATVQQYLSLGNLLAYYYLGNTGVMRYVNPVSPMTYFVTGDPYVSVSGSGDTNVRISGGVG